ncbi:hypothetical protein EON83_14365 [bacterium]|nr:MAG: hypothetical protein EON83_14365 [bacterium]
MNRLGELHTQLSDEWRLLNAHWQKAEVTWRDNSEVSVVRGFWDTLDQSVPPALRELEEIISLVDALERRIEATR